MNNKLSFKPSKKLIDSIKEADIEYKKGNMKKYKSVGELFKALFI